MIILSDEFYREILSHPVPTDLELPRSFQPALQLSTCLPDFRTGALPRVGASD